MSALSAVPRNFFALTDESVLDEKPRHQDRILPRTRDICRSRPSRKRRSKTTSHQGQSENEEDKGFRTMLEEMRIPSDQRPKRSREKAQNPYASRQRSQNSEPNHQQIHVASNRGPDVNHGSTRSDSNRYVSGGSTSRDSYSAKKEATFEFYENNDKDESSRDRKQGPRSEHLGKPSPGEGLRNALGNLDNRLHQKQSIEGTNLNRDRELKRGQKSSLEKGFATLVEELVQPPRSRKGICLGSLFLTG